MSGDKVSGEGGEWGGRGGGEEVSGEGGEWEGGEEVSGEGGDWGGGVVKVVRR